MKTLQQICLENRTLVDGDKRLELKRGEEYITSLPNGDGDVIVFSSYHARVPDEWFGGAEEFTA